MSKPPSPPPNRRPAIPAPGEGKRGEQGHIGYLLQQAAAAHRLRMERALSDLRVTPPQFAILTMIAAYPGISNADLAKLTSLTPQTITVIVGNLEKAGSIERQPSASHGRILENTITTGGQSLLADCRQRVAVVEAELLADLPANDEQVLRRWLVRTTL